MLQGEFRTAYILSIIITVLLIIVSAGGLFVDGLYQDNPWVTTQLQGNDLVTLIVAVPLLVAGMYFTKRGSDRGLLIWMAMLGYTLYGYGFYLFGATFNDVFLVYVALFSLSIFALVAGLIRLDAAAIAKQFKTSTPIRWICGYMMLVAVFLGILWTAQSVGFIASGTLPQVIVDSGHPTSIVFALDLALLVPCMVLGAVWLWQRKPWGYVLSAIMVLKGTTYSLALVGMAVFAANADIPGALDMLPFWSLFTLAGLLASGFLLGNMQSAE